MRIYKYFSKTLKRHAYSCLILGMNLFYKFLSFVWALNSKMKINVCPISDKEIDGNAEKRMQENEKKAKETADRLFPEEKWNQKTEYGERIYVSDRRKIGNKTNFKDELHDAQILRDLGSTVYLVPENNRSNEKQFDAIVDGERMELKNQKGKSVRTLKDHFIKSREQAPSVFINLENSPLSKHKIISTVYKVRNSNDFKETKYPNGGVVILKINGNNSLIKINIDDMKG